MTNQQYEIINRSPTVEEHNLLWESVGWGAVDVDQSKQSLENSVYAVVAMYDGNVLS
ncbi:hypothetical protein [Paenibacillus sp. IHBB 10380]|uniref:hypothetical protein n=1 Tax=Paenibacillus sp. IHBB 10380 TaxID=1566358 RepID=UPI000AE3B9CE|nr:hypothetical protein [Paenibacillus sp. IHBB 10380]